MKNTDINNLRKELAETKKSLQKEKKANAEIEHWASFPKLIPLPIFEMDMRGKIRYINYSAEKWFHEINVKGSKYPLLRTILKDIKLAKKDKKNYTTAEFFMEGKWFTVGIFFLRREKSFASVYINDITERKNNERKEKELLAAKAKIDIECAKTSKLEKAYDELKEMQEKLIRSEKLAVLGKLAGSVSHELRNPLSVITNSVYFLKMKLGPKFAGQQIKKHLNILEKEIEISDKIINDILSFSKTKEIQFFGTDINKIIKSLLKIRKIPKKIKISSKLDNNLPIILADEAQIKQVFSNIILNAVQSMPNGGKITISTRVNNEIIEVEIIDTGVGISKENLTEVFTPLFSTKAQGIGFGLAICQSIIEAHKGSIEVESAIGKGTKFIVKLPINKNQEGKTN